MGKSETLYKLTNQNHCSYGNTKWGARVTHQVRWMNEMCEYGCLHAYRSREIAALLYPAHVRYKEPVPWLARGVVRLDDGTKVGCARLTTIRRTKLPEVTHVNRVSFAILCAMDTREGLLNDKWRAWAKRWLSDEDRSYDISKELYYKMATTAGTQRLMATATATVTGMGTATAMAMVMAMGTLTVTATPMVTAMAMARTVRLAFASNKELDVVRLAKKAMTYE